MQLLGNYLVSTNKNLQLILLEIFEHFLNDNENSQFLSCYSFHFHYLLNNNIINKNSPSHIYLIFDFLIKIASLEDDKSYYNFRNIF